MAEVDKHSVALRAGIGLALAAALVGSVAYLVGLTQPPLTSRSTNPLLAATRPTIQRWFPGYCFAELYIAKQPSFGGPTLARHCVQRIIDEVQQETGFELTEQDLHTPEVLAHFSRLTGQEIAWRR